MPFPKLYQNEPCPIEGYEAYTLRVWVNPPPAVKDAWYAGLAKLAGQDYAAFGAAAVPIYGETKAEGLDFSTEEAAAETASCEDLPDELFAWLLMLPGALWQARTDDLKKKLASASPTTN